MEMARKAITTPRKSMARRLPPAEGDIRLGLAAKLLINVFTLCDGYNAMTGRKHFAHAPYAYGPYLARSGATTFSEKMRVIWAAKQEKTRKLIRARRRYGTLPQHYKHVCRKTPCGVLRLWAAYLD